MPVLLTTASNEIFSRLLVMIGTKLNNVNLLRIWIYSILLLLLLEVLKTLISRVAFAQSYFTALIISCIQVLILLGALLIPFIYRLIRKVRRPLTLSIVIFFSIIAVLEGFANRM